MTRFSNAADYIYTEQTLSIGSALWMDENLGLGVVHIWASGKRTWASGTLHTWASGTLHNTGSPQLIAQTADLTCPLAYRELIKADALKTNGIITKSFTGRK